MSKILARLLCVVILINSIFCFSINSIFAADGSGYTFDWEKTQTLDNNLNVQTRGSNYDEAFFWWNFGVNDGLSFDSGQYTLSYNISDDKRVDFVVDKAAAMSTVTYKVWNYVTQSYIDLADTVYQVYNSNIGNYVVPSSTTLPVASPTFCVNYGLDGKPTEVSFNIIRGTGFAFKFDNRNIKFKWAASTSGDLFYFVTDGLQQGVIYDINLDLQITNSSHVENSLQIFTGISADTFKSTPYANDRTGDKSNPIDHTITPRPENPGFEPELVLNFDMPRIWDDNTKKYVFPDPKSMTDDDRTSVIIDMSNVSDKKKIQISINNVYADDIDSVTTIATASDATAEAWREDNKVYINIKNLESATIYNPVELSLYKPNKAEFLSVSTELELGTIYTYPEYSIISMATDEYYIQIEPFKGYSGFYTIYQGLTSETLTKWADYEDHSGGTESILIPVDLNAVNQKTRLFRVDFEVTPPNNTPGQVAVKTTSQILKYAPKESDIIIGTPRNLEVTSLNIVYVGTDTSKKEMVLALKWDVAYVEVLKNLIERNGGKLDVDYVFYKGDIPYDSNEEKFSTITLSMTLDGDDINVTMSDAEGRLENYSTTIRQEYVGEDAYQIAVANVTLRIPVANVEEKSEQFLYPNIYFINTKGVYDIGNSHYETSASLPVNITLNDLTDSELPQPQNFKINPDTIATTSFTARWRSLTYGSTTSDLYNYSSKMLDTMGYSVGEKSIKYNLYISQSKDALDNLMKYDATRNSLPSSVVNSLKSYDYNSNEPTEGLDVSQSFSSDGTNLRAWLRKDNIVKIENVLQDTNPYQNFEFRGLDKNQDYYLIAETVIIPYDGKAGEYIDQYVDHSSYCEMVSGTTLKDSESPSDEENDPSAPTNFRYSEVQISSAQLFWDKVHENPDPDSSSVLEYQFVRIVGKQMTDDLMKSKQSFDDTWAKLPANVGLKGWRTDGSNLFEYLSGEFSSTPIDTKKMDYDESNYTTSVIADKTLMPNELYFYYIRTVRVTDGNDMAYSVWVPLTLTTTPIGGPNNLKVELNEKYDKQTEVAISFDIPNIDMDDLGTIYDIQYSTKIDGENWEEDTNMAREDITYTEAADGTKHCLYIIRNLEPGTAYHIRIRLYNHNLDEVSIYSNVVYHKTNLDQNSSDKDHTIDDWIDHYKDLIEDMLKKPYWVMEDTLTNTIAIYRPGPFSGLIAGTPESVIDLVSGENNGINKTYYLPSTAIEEAYTANKGFRIRYNEMEVIVGPKSIDPIFNDSIVDVKEAIDTGDIKDYFVKLTVKFSNVTYEVNGGTPVSPMVDIELETVGSRSDILEWDATMITELFNLALDEDDLDELRKDIRDLFNDKEASKQFVKLIKTSIDSYMDDFERELDKKFERVTKKNYISQNFNGNVIIAYPVDSGTSVSGNRQNHGAWVGYDVTDYNGKKAMYTTYPGLYIFTGKTLTITGITGTPNGTIITSIVAKYGLDDYLGKDGAININGNLTKTMALGCSARLSGAAKTDDPAIFLTSKGVANVGRGSQTTVSTQEAIYLTMMVYQVRTNTKVDTMQIRNFGATSNIAGISNAYKKSVQAAFETGIYNNANMNANGTITVKEYLNMLAQLATKARLV